MVAGQLDVGRMVARHGRSLKLYFPGSLSTSDAAAGRAGASGAGLLEFGAMGMVSSATLNPPHVDFRPMLDRCFDLSFFLFVFLTVFLPGGTIYGFPFKYPLYAVLIPLALYGFFTRRSATLSRILILLAAPLVLSAWSFLGIWNGFESAGALRQYLDFILTLLLCWMAAAYYANDQVRKIRFLRLVVFAEVATSVMKLGLIVYADVRGISILEMVKLLDVIFSANLMTMDISESLARIQFISDSLIAISVYAILRHKYALKLGNWQALIFINLLVASCLFSFSRYFWGATTFAFLLGLLLAKREKFKLYLVLALVLSIIALLPTLDKFYELRFSSTVENASDSQRTGQVQALEDFFWQSPMLGHGLGSYTRADIRGEGDSGKYAYEVQTLALFGQMGVVGMGILGIFILYYYRALWTTRSLSLPDRLALGALIVVWLLAGFTNPLIVSPIAGICFASLDALSGIPSKA
jgi:hypothetical protein